LKRSLWALVIAVPLVALLALGFSRRPDAPQSPLISKPAATFSLRTLDHRTVALAALRGRPVLLNFWASWCKECPADQALLRDAWRQYGKQGVAFVGVSYQDSAPAARAFLRQYGAGWPTVLDRDQQTAIDYGVYGVPETFLIDRRGVIRWKSTGTPSWEALSQQLDRLLARGA